MCQFFPLCVSKKAVSFQRVTENLKKVYYVKFSECAVLFSSSDGVG